MPEATSSSKEQSDLNAQKIIETLKPGKKLHDKLAGRFREQYQIRDKL